MRFPSARTRFPAVTAALTDWILLRRLRGLIAELDRSRARRRRIPDFGAKRARVCDGPQREWKVPADAEPILGKPPPSAKGVRVIDLRGARDRPSGPFVPVSDNTWQAYTAGPRVLRLTMNGKSQWYWGDNVQVDFRRPTEIFQIPRRAAFGPGSWEWFLWEFPFAFWLEQHGYDSSYIPISIRIAMRPSAPCKGLLTWATTGSGRRMFPTRMRRLRAGFRGLSSPSRGVGRILLLFADADRV